MTMKPQFRKTLKSFRLTDMSIRPSFISGSGEQLYEAVMDLETPDNPKRYIAICQTPGPEDTSEPCPPRSLHNCKIMDLAVLTFSATRSVARLQSSTSVMARSAPLRL